MVFGLSGVAGSSPQRLDPAYGDGGEGWTGRPAGVAIGWIETRSGTPPEARLARFDLPNCVGEVTWGRKGDGGSLSRSSF